MLDNRMKIEIERAIKGFTTSKQILEDAYDELQELCEECRYNIVASNEEPCVSCEIANYLNQLPNVGI